MLSAGMLWYENSLVSLADKVQHAVDYYKKKYSRTPDMCLVHPSMMKDQPEIQFDGLTVRPFRYVLPGHLWIGIDDSGDIQKLKANNEARS